MRAQLWPIVGCLLALSCSSPTVKKSQAPSAMGGHDAGADAATASHASSSGGTAGASSAVAKPDAGRGAPAKSDAGRAPDAAAPPPSKGSSPDSGNGSLADSGSAPACPGAKPDATNTGVPAGVKLTAVNQDVTVTQDNTLIDSQDIHGFLTIKASHVKVLRSIVRGHTTSATTAIIRIDSGADILIEDTEVAAAEPSVDVDGVSGAGFTARRLHIHGGVDGMKLGTGAVVECSYIHDLASFASDPNQNGGATHNDAIQILAGTDIRIVGNQLVAAKDQNSAIQITQDFGMVGNVHIEHNWADGGGCTFNISHKGAASLSDIFTTGNRFGRNSFYDCPILKSTQTTITSSGDVWDDDGTPVPIQTHD